MHLHLTALEITHSRTALETAPLVAALQPLLETLTDLPAALAEQRTGRRARLVRPMLTYDAAAVALSYLPSAAGAAGADVYTYHHLRRDLWDVASATSARNAPAAASAAPVGVPIASRYTVASAHLTLARFVTVEQAGPERVRALVAAIEAANVWMEEEVWGRSERGGEWIVGEEQGLDCRVGALWYGGGETVRLGRAVEL